MFRHLPRLRTLLRWRYLRWALAGAMVPAVLWACTPHPLQAPDPFPETQTDLNYEVNPIRKLDLLVVVDNSDSMREEQENLARNFPIFMRQLENIPGGLPDLRLAVINTDMGAGNAPAGALGTCQPLGDRGRFQVKNPMMDCGLHPNTANWIIANSTGRNFNGDLSNVFACIARQGINGCGFEHQLQAIRAALAGGMVNPENHNFLRDDAYLGIIILSDEDDCSADPESGFFLDETNYKGQAFSLRCALLGHVCDGQAPQAMAGFTKPLSSCTYGKRSAGDKGKLINVEEIIGFVRDVKGGRADRVIASAVIGMAPNADSAQYKIDMVNGPEGNVLDLLPACQTNNGKAAHGIRLKAFVDAFTPNNVYSICEAQLDKAMEAIGKKVAEKLVNTCFNDPFIDTDANPMNGLQPDCRVSDIKPQGADNVEQPIAQCGMGVAAPCWKLVADGGCGSGFKVEVDRGGKMAPPGTVQSIKCLTCTSTRANDPRCFRR